MERSPGQNRGGIQHDDPQDDHGRHDLRIGAGVVDLDSGSQALTGSIGGHVVWTAPGHDSAVARVGVLLATMQQHGTFSILTARLRLRPLKASDHDALAEIYLHPDVARWIGPHTRQDVENEIAKHAAYQSSLGWSFWAVEDRATSHLIGDCGLQPLEHRGPEIELGYDFHPRVWGRGIATEAARAVMRQALGPLALDRVVAVVKPDHIASQRVLVKAGLRSAGTRLAYGERMLLYESSPPAHEVPRSFSRAFRSLP